MYKVAPCRMMLDTKDLFCWGGRDGNRRISLSTLPEKKRGGDKQTGSVHEAQNTGELSQVKNCPEGVFTSSFFFLRDLYKIWEGKKQKWRGKMMHGDQQT